MSKVTAAAWGLLSAVEAGEDQPALDAAARALRSALAEQIKPRPVAPMSTAPLWTAQTHLIERAKHGNA